MSVKHVLGLVSFLGICCMDVFALEVKEDVVIPTEEFTVVSSIEVYEEKASELHTTYKSLASKKADMLLQAIEFENDLCVSTEPNVSSNRDCNSAKKTYMYYTSVTNEATEQYKLLNSDSCYTDSETGVRMVGNRYCIALGTGYCSEVGTRVNLVLEDGSIIKCILGDVKSDRHTDNETHTYHVGGYEGNQYYKGDGSVAEFIVDKDVFLDVREDKSGTVNWVDGFDGKIEKVVIIPDDAVLAEDL